MFTWINIAGLSIGLTVVLLICAFVFSEYSFDKLFTHPQRIFRANSYVIFPGMEGNMTNVSSTALASATMEEVPGVVNAVRIFVNPTDVKAGDVPIFCPSAFYVKAI